MLLNELFTEAVAKKVVAVIPGGYHPYHPGHKSVYDWTVKKFGAENVYVAATNDTSTRPFPFETKKKLAAMAGIPSDKFIQVKSPFNANSYSELLDSDTAIIYVRSEKDQISYPLPDQTKKDGTPAYFKSYTGKDMEDGMSSGYMLYAPTINFSFKGLDIKSATEIRTAWPNMSDEEKLQAAQQMYGKGAEEAVELLDQAIGGTNEIMGFATRRPKSYTVKKRPPEKDDKALSQKVQDKLKQYRKDAKTTEAGGLRQSAGMTKSAVIQMIADKIDDQYDINDPKDVEQLDKLLRSLVGKKIVPYGKNSYTITDEDITLAMEAAGVGIITKQNTTKDVNKGTLKKMMKGYKLI